MYQKREQNFYLTWKFNHPKFLSTHSLDNYSPVSMNLDDPKNTETTTLKQKKTKKNKRCHPLNSRTGLNYFDVIRLQPNLDCMTALQHRV